MPDGHAVHPVFPPVLYAPVGHASGVCATLVQYDPAGQLTQYAQFVNEKDPFKHFSGDMPVSEQ